MQHSTICLTLDMEEFTAMLTCHNDLKEFKVNVSLTEINVIRKQTERLTAGRHPTLPQSRTKEFLCFLGTTFSSNPSHFPGPWPAHHHHSLSHSPPQVGGFMCWTIRRDLTCSVHREKDYIGWKRCFIQGPVGKGPLRAANLNYFSLELLSSQVSPSLVAMLGGVLFVCFWSFLIHENKFGHSGPNLQWGSTPPCQLKPRVY